MGADQTPDFISSGSTSKPGSVYSSAVSGKKNSSNGKARAQYRLQSSSSGDCKLPKSSSDNSRVGGSSLARLEAKFKDRPKGGTRSSEGTLRSPGHSTKPPPSSIYYGKPPASTKRRSTKENSAVQQELEQLFAEDRLTKGTAEGLPDSTAAVNIRSRSSDYPAKTQPCGPDNLHTSRHGFLAQQAETEEGGSDSFAGGQDIKSKPRLQTTTPSHQFESAELGQPGSPRDHNTGSTECGSAKAGANPCRVVQTEDNTICHSLTLPNQQDSSSEIHTQLDRDDMPSEGRTIDAGHLPARALGPDLPAQRAVVEQLDSEPRRQATLQPLTESEGNKPTKTRVRMSDSTDGTRPSKPRQPNASLHSASSKRLPSNWREERLKDARSQRSMRHLKGLAREPSKVDADVLYSQHSFLPPRQPSGVPQIGSQPLVSKNSFLPPRQPSTGADLAAAARQKSNLQHAVTGGSELSGAVNQHPAVGLSTISGAKSFKSKQGYLAAGLSKKSFHRRSQEQSVSRRQSRMSNGAGLDERLPSLPGRQNSGVVQASFKVSVSASQPAVTLPSISKQSRSKAEKSFRKSAPTLPTSYQKMFEAAEAAHAQADAYERLMRRNQAQKCAHQPAAPKGKGKGKGHKHRRRMVKITLI